MQDICDRVAILLNGEICTQGAVKDLLINPDTLRLSLQSPPRESLSAILNYIEQETGQRPLVDHAGRTLESVFIETVTRRPSPL